MELRSGIGFSYCLNQDLRDVGSSGFGLAVQVSSGITFSANRVRDFLYLFVWDAPAPVELEYALVHAGQLFLETSQLLYAALRVVVDRVAQGLVEVPGGPSADAAGEAVPRGADRRGGGVGDGIHHVVVAPVEAHEVVGLPSRFGDEEGYVDVEGLGLVAAVGGLGVLELAQPVNHAGHGLAEGRAYDADAESGGIREGFVAVSGQRSGGRGRCWG